MSFSPKIPLWMLLLVLTISIVTSSLLVGWSFFAPQILAFTTFLPQMSKTTEVEPKESLVITFPKPVLDDTYRQNIHIVPSIPFYAKWEESHTRLILTPQTHWDIETRYTLTLPEGTHSAFLASNPQASTFTFETIPYPKVLDVTPKNGTKDVVMDIEDPVIINFTKSTRNFWIDFSLSPTAETTFENNPEKTQFKILPKTTLAVGTAYTLTVFSHIKDDDTDAPKQIFTMEFTTLLPAPKEVSKDPAEKLAQAKLSTPPKFTEGKYIDVNLETQTMVTFENGTALDAYLVSSGRRGMQTPKGDFTIHNKAPRPWSKAHSLFMPHWMAITSDGEYGIHELPEWPGGYKEGANHLGTPVSHGCVRLGVGPAEIVYNWAEVGTPVFIH